MTLAIACVCAVIVLSIAYLVTATPKRAKAVEDWPLRAFTSTAAVATSSSTQADAFNRNYKSRMLGSTEAILRGVERGVAHLRPDLSTNQVEEEAWAMVGHSMEAYAATIQAEDMLREHAARRRKNARS